MRTLAPTNAAIAATIVEKYRGKALTLKAARAMTQEITEAIRLRTSQMLTYGPQEVERIARWSQATPEICSEILHEAGGRCLSAEEVEAAWAETPREPTGAMLNDVGIDYETLEDEILTLLHASRDGMRNAGIDTTRVAYDLNRDGGYQCEVFGMLRALRLMGYGYFGDANGAVKREDRHNLSAMRYRLEQRVLEDEHFKTTNECDHCLKRYGKDAAGRRR